MMKTIVFGGLYLKLEFLLCTAKRLTPERLRVYLDSLRVSRRMLFFGQT